MKIPILDDVVTDAYLKYRHSWLYEDFEKTCN